MTLFKGSCNIWIHFDHEILFVFDLFVSRINPVLHPLCKRLANISVDHVNDELPWQFSNLFRRWKIPFYLRVLLCVLQKVIHCQSFEVRNCEVLAKITLDKLFVSWCNVFQEVDGNTVNRRKVGFDFRSQKPVHLCLWIELSCEFSCSNFYRTRSKIGSSLGVHKRHVTLITTVHLYFAF